MNTANVSRKISSARRRKMCDVYYLGILIDEIALEGLDGITISALWTRLQCRPNFAMPLDEPAKNYFWRICVLLSDVEAFSLSEARPPLIIYNRFANVDSDTGLINEPGENHVDIYPICIVKDQKDLGSCGTYYTRTNVTSELRSTDNGNQLLMTLNQAMDKWGDRLVLVASAESRHRALFYRGSDPDVHLNQMQYVMLERIGRSRYLGEVTQGRYSLADLHSSAKTLFYHRKLLLSYGLVIKQLHYQKSCNGQLRSSMLLHLPRFYVERKSKVILMLEDMCRFLQTKPDHSSTYELVRAHMGLKQNILKHTLRKCFDKLTESLRIPVRDINPSASDDQLYFKNKSLKMVRVLRLRDNVNPDHLEKVLHEEEAEIGTGGAKHGSKKAGSDDDGADEDEELMEEEDISENLPLDQGAQMALRTRGIPNPRNLVCARPLLHQAYTIGATMGPEGGSIQQYGKAVGVPRLETRTLCRNLERTKVVSAIMKDSGRQRVTRYITNGYMSTSQEHQQLYKECKKMLEYTKGSSETIVQPAPVVANESSVGKSENDLPFISELSNDSEIVQMEQQTKEEADVPMIKQGPGTLLEDIQKICAQENRGGGLNLTTRLVKRANLILQAVREAKVISNHVTLQRLIMTSESDEGSRVDRKSIFRLIKRLDKEGYLKYVQSILKHDGKERRIHLICDPSLSNNDPLIVSALEQAKFKYFAISNEASKAMYRDVKKLKKQKDEKEEAEPADEPNNPIRMSVLELRNLYDSELNRSLLEFNYKIGRLYGHEPKFMRLKGFHEFLFYLVYAYEGKEDLPVPLEVKNAEIKQGVTWPKVYHPEISWKMFVSPLPKHKGWRTGWCLFSDVLLRMPLSLLVKLVNYNFKIEGIHEYLNDPMKCHLPISRLPQHFRNYLLYARKYIFSSHDAATKLAYMGLLTFSQREHKDKDQVFMFVHSKARVVDTTISNPGYHKISADKEYPVRDYYLQTMSDLHGFWMDLETVCMSTPLGSYSHDQGKALTFETIYKKTQLIEAAASKKDEEIVDEWVIPGDGLGAGGLDSAFFSHLKRNWSWVTVSTSGTKTGLAIPMHSSKNVTGSLNVGFSSPMKPKSIMVNFKDSSEESESGAPIAKKRMARLAVNTQLSTLPEHENAPAPVIRDHTFSALKQKQQQNLTVVKEKSKHQGPTVRILKKRLKRVRKPYYDDKDRAALQLVRKRRVAWSSKEDSMLLLCKVASNLFDVNGKYLIFPYSAIRDFLHKHVEASKDKTSRACQRRLHYMLKNSETVFNISVFVGESLQENDISELCNLPYVPRTNEAEWVSRFEALMAKLILKFETPSTVREDMDGFPDTLEEFQKQYKITHAKEFANAGYVPKDVQNVVDIHSHVVKTLILSAAATVNDEINWAYYLYQIYGKYPEPLLHSAVAKLRSDHVLTKRKNFGRGAKRRMMLVMMPYQLSVKYDYLFLNPVRAHIFPESFEIIQNMLCHSLNNDHGLPIECDVKGGHAATILSLAATENVQFEVTVPDEVITLNVEERDSNCKNIVKKMRVWENKEKEIQENSSAPGEQSETNASSADDAENPAKRIRVDANAEDFEKLTKQVQVDADADDPENPAKRIRVDANAEDFEKLSKQVQVDADAEDSGKPPAKRIRVDADAEAPIHPAVDTEECVPMVVSKRNDPPMTRSSRFALYMLRQEKTNAQIDNSQHFHDYLRIKPCMVRCRLKNLEKPLHSMYPFEKEDIQRIFSKVIVYLPLDDVSLDTVKEHYHFNGHGEDVIKEMEEIYFQIFQRKEMGEKMTELREWFKTQCGTLPLAMHIELMIKCNLIVYVGTFESRLVALTMATPWLVCTYKIKAEKVIHVEDKETVRNANDQTSATIQEISHTDNLESTDVAEVIGDEASTVMSTPCQPKMPKMKGIPPPDFNDTSKEPIRFIGRLWRKPNGAVNVQELRSLLYGIATRILSYPGIKLEDLCQKHAKVLSAVQLNELLDIMKEAKCVYKIVIKKSHETHPFSPIVEIVNENEEEAGAMVHYVPHVDCIIRLSQLLSDEALKLQGWI